MKLSIITINLNNLTGLKKTVESVLSQSALDFEYIIVDGGSSDGSKEYIQIKSQENKRITHWIGEPDNGIYHAMNKGIKMASGEYVQFLNSGDYLVSSEVLNEVLYYMPLGCDILYGNMLKQFPTKIHRDYGIAGREPSMIYFILGTLNHASAFIKRELFEKFGYYDESLKIVSDWKWFMDIIIFNNIKPVYTNLDICVFDTKGLSSTSSKLIETERKKVLDSLFPEKVVTDFIRLSKYGLHSEYLMSNFFTKAIYKILLRMVPKSKVFPKNAI